MKTPLNIAALLLAALLTVGCDNDGPMEEAGEAIDNTVEDVSDAADDACEELKEGVDADDTDC